MIMNRCLENGCRELTTDKYCKRHEMIHKIDKQLRANRDKELKQLSKGYQESERHTRYVHSDRFDEIDGQFYQQYRWQKLSKQILMRDLYTCQICNHVQSRGESMIVDHVVKRRVNPELSYSESDLWTLCRTCHNKKSSLEDRLTNIEILSTNKDYWIKMLQ